MVAIAAAVAAVARKLVPSFSSLMRSACLQRAAAHAALLGEWSAALRDGALVLGLPADVELATACVDALLPMLGHAVAQAGERTPPML